MNSLKTRLLRESQRHSLFMLASFFGATISVCGAITSIYNETLGGVAGFGFFTVFLIVSTLHHGSESWRHLGLYFNELEFERDKI